MLNDAREKSFIQYVRLCDMEAMACALRMFKESGNEELYVWAMKMGEWSKYWKKELLTFK